MAGKVYGTATGLYNKHQECSEQRYLGHPFRSAYNFQLTYSVSQQNTLSMDYHLRCTLHNLKIEWLQSGDAPPMCFIEVDFSQGDDYPIENHLHIFRTSHYRDIFQYKLYRWVYLPFQLHLHYLWLLLAESERCEIPMTWAWAIGGGNLTIHIMPKQWLWLSLEHLARLIGSIFQTISITGQCITRYVINEIIPFANLHGVPGLPLG